MSAAGNRVPEETAPKVKKEILEEQREKSKTESRQVLFRTLEIGTGRERCGGGSCTAGSGRV